MDVFQIHSQVVADYQSYIRSFIRIKDDAILKAVEEELGRGRLWCGSTRSSQARQSKRRARTRRCAWHADS